MKPLYTLDEFNNSKSFDKLPMECELCGKTFYAEKANVKFEQKHTERNRLRFCSIKCNSLNRENKIIFNCKNCNKECSRIISETKSKNQKNLFCSNSCSATYNNLHKEDRIKKLKMCAWCKKEFETNHTKKYCSKNCQNNSHEVGITKRKFICKNCNKEFESKKKIQKFCSRSCSSTFSNIKNKEKLRKGGLKSAQIQSEIRRSKNEIAFAELCKNKFKNILTNKSIFNGWDADVIVEDIKVAILWNGAWHYKEISKKSSLKQIQNRDKIKLIEIKNCGYVSYVIEDLGKYNIKKVELEFDKFLEWIKNNSLFICNI